MKLKWCVVVSWEFSGAEGRVFFVCVCVRDGIAGRDGRRNHAKMCSARVCLCVLLPRGCDRLLCEVVCLQNSGTAVERVPIAPKYNPLLSVTFHSNVVMFALEMIAFD